MEKKLYRDEHNKKIGGVCAGLADYFGIDVTIVRVLFAVSFLLKGVGLLPYIVLWAVLPKRNSFLNNNFNRPGYNPNFNTAGYTPGVDYTIPPPPAPGQPFVYPPQKKSSGAGVIFGVVLIALGSLFLLDQFDFIPELDFENLWPVILVVIGLAIIFSGRKKEPWEKAGWQETAVPEQPTETPAAEKTEDKPNDNPTIL